MDINLTERRLPAGKVAADMGQSVSSFDGNLVLISYQESPIVVDYIQNYVLFVLDNSIADSIKEISWSAFINTVQNVTININVSSPTQATLIATSKGKLSVTVEVFYKNGNSETITLTQVVKDRFLRIPPRTDNYLAALGNPPTTSWIIDSYIKYLLGVKNAEDNYHTELRFLIASLMYSNLMSYEPTDYHSTPIPYVDKDNNFSRRDLFYGVGVTSIRPFALFYLYTQIVQPPTVPATLYTAELNYAQFDFFLDVQKDIYESRYSVLDMQIKIDFFNLLRFPKSHIDICKQFLLFLKKKYYPNDTLKDIMDDEAKLSALINQFYWGPYDNTINLLETDVYDATEFKDISQYVLNAMSSIDFFRQMLSIEKYGNYDLRKDDSDVTRKYEGIIRSLASSTPGFIQNLKTDLLALGFRMFDSADGNYDTYTEWAVREFQIYASMEKIALYDVNRPTVDNSIADKLVSTNNNLIYTGPISGVLNLETRIILQYWVEQGYRCPVVVAAFNMLNNARHTIHTDNIWRHNQMTDTAPRVFVKDFTEYYNLKNPHLSRYFNDWMVVGEYTRFDGFDGPRTKLVSQTWPECITTPMNVMGKEWGTMTDAEKSTFRVIAAVAYVECTNYFDALNAYDIAKMSVGLCHWTFFIGEELGGLLAFYKASPANVQDFDFAFTFFGLKVAKDWETSAGINSGQSLYNYTHRKYTSSIYLQSETSYDSITETNKDYVRNWHWYYRFVITSRVVNTFQRCQYDMLRLRIRDLRNVVYTTNSGDSIYTTPTGSSAGATVANLQEVFSSEKAFAMLLRIHVNSPACVFNTRDRIRDGILHIAYNSLTAQQKTSFFTNADAGQINIVDKMLDMVTNAGATTITYDSNNNVIRSVNVPNQTPGSRKEIYLDSSNAVINTKYFIDGENISSVRSTLPQIDTFNNNILVINEVLTLRETANSFLFHDAGLEIYPLP